ncbi:hypothetical protein KFL_002840010, partial [Klebsormidium nitens]
MAPPGVSLTSLPEEVLSQILARAENPQSLTATCRSLLAAAHDVQTQAEWWHFNQSKTSLLRLFRWRWLQNASLPPDQLDKFLVSILTKRLKDAQASWHGGFAVARAAVLLELPQTFQILLSRGVADPFKLGGVLVADMLVLNRNEMLQQVKQKIGEGKIRGGTSNYQETDLWWNDMRSVVKWWMETPAEEPMRVLAAAESVEAQKRASVQLSEAETESVMANESAPEFETGSDSDEDCGAEDTSSKESFSYESDDKMLSAFQSFVQFTRGVMHVGSEFEEQLSRYEIGDKILWDGIGRFADRDCMKHLAHAVLSGCKAGVPESFLRNLLTILPKREKNTAWKEQLLTVIRAEVVESGLEPRALDALETALWKEDYTLCLEKLRAWRDLDGESPNWGASHLVAPRVIERADEADIALAVLIAHKDKMVGFESEFCGSEYAALPALLES